MTYTLSKPSQTIITQGSKILSANNLTLSSPADQKAAAVFRFVRDEIRFGFTSRFDYATPEKTLASRRGHCNPQSALFASLLNGVGVKASQRFVELSPDVLYGVLSGPTKLVHSCVVVDTGSGVCNVDGFIAGVRLFQGAKEMLRKEGRRNGYGVANDGCCEWQGRGDCFVQMTNGVGKELGVFDEPMQFLDSKHNFQKLGAGGRFFLGMAAGWVNRGIDRIARNSERVVVSVNVDLTLSSGIRGSVSTARVVGGFGYVDCRQRLSAAICGRGSGAGAGDCCC